MAERHLTIWGLILGVILIVPESRAANQILEVRQKLYPQPEKTRAEGKSYLFHSAVSQKNLLGLERKSLFSLPEPSSISAQPATIKILAVRVSFPREIPDDPTTTGNGVFDMRPFEDFRIEEGHEIDPSPHDDAYFRSHLEALNNYWSTVSKGKIDLQYDVYPLASYIFYELPHGMAYYGQQRPDSGLGELFQDTWQLVDQQNPEIDFSQYQAFIIFHAGSDQQSNLSFSPTNTLKDLFTAFILMGEGDSVSVDSGAVLIGEGLIMPETVSQDTRIAALNAVMAHEFGHQLGLVDLYKTYDAIRQEPVFTTQVGDFSLMDNNGLGVAVDLGFRSPVFGTLPVYPDAWSRAYLGFDLPAEIQSQQDALVRAAGLWTDSLQIIKIPINSQEYFLLENRFIDLDKDGRTDLKGDPVTGVILGPGKLVGATPVLTREYDALLPGSGMLIWQVDEGVAYLDYDYDGLNNFLSNTLQGDKERRFVSLEEADGIIDFGGDYYTGFGSQEDMYYRENNSAITPTTYPSSRSNTGADTHIRVTGIGRRDTVMQCDVEVDLYQPGWPQRFKPASNTSSLVAFDVVGDTVPELFLSSGNKIYAWKKDGSKLIDNLDTDTFTIYDQESTSVYQVAVFAITDAPIVGAPAIADLDGSDTLGPLVVAGTESGLIYVWKTVDENLDGYADLMPSYPYSTVCTEMAHQPVIGKFIPPYNDLEALVPCKEGRIYFIGPYCCPFQLQTSNLPRGVALSIDTGFYYILRESNQTFLSRETAFTPQWTKLISATGFFAPVAGDIDRNGVEDVVAVNKDGFVIAYDSAGSLMDGYPVNLGEKVYSKPVLGDIDGDGHLEILFGGENKIWALNYNGTVASNFPVIIGRAEPVGPVTSSPILVDLNSDFRTEVIVGSPGREILVYTGLGERPNGFPLSTADTVLTSGLVANFDRTGGTDSERELAFACSDGFVYVWNISGTYDSSVNFWVMENYDASHSNLFPSGKLPTPPIAGPNLVEPKRFYSYPNPASGQAIVRYYLNYDSQVELKFFDLAGNLVDTHQAKGQAFTDNEFIWNCSGMASGVYLCRIEAKGQGKSQTEFCKIAIVK